MKFDIITIDPPWSFKVWSPKGSSRSAENHYNCMTFDDIKNMDINSLAKDDCVLFLWVTNPFLEKAFECIKSWGFAYKTVGFVWVKSNKVSTNTLFWGQGYYTRQNVELCLIATKGKPLPRQSKGIHQVIQSPVEQHSKKPQEFRDRINQMYGNVNVVEIFARNNFHEKYGWTLIGNEVTGNDIVVDIENLKNK